MNIFGRIVSLSERVHEKQQLVELLAEFAVSAGGQASGIRQRGKDQFVPLSLAALDEFTTTDGDLVFDLLLTAMQSDKIKVGVLWRPFPYVASLRAAFCLNLSFRFVQDVSLSEAEGVLRKAVEIFVPYWGELNDKRVSGALTFCGPNSHKNCIPHLGNINYLGEQYVRLFGGKKSLKACGLSRVQFDDRGGAFVRLSTVCSKAAFLEEQGAVERAISALSQIRFDSVGFAPKLWASGVSPEWR